MLATEFNWNYSKVVEEVECNTWTCKWKLLTSLEYGSPIYVILNAEQEVGLDYWEVYAFMHIGNDDFADCRTLHEDDTKYNSAEEAKTAAENWFNSWLNSSFGASLKD